MATIPGAILLCASSPYARKGALFDAYRKHFGKDGDPILVWHAPTRDMNPCVPQAVIDAATERDPAHAAAEYLAEFRSDIESFIKFPEVERCVATGIDCASPGERMSLPGVRRSERRLEQLHHACDCAPGDRQPRPSRRAETRRSVQRRMNRPSGRASIRHSEALASATRPTVEPNAIRTADVRESGSCPRGRLCGI